MHIFPFDRGSLERDIVYDEPSTGRRIQDGDQVEKFRSVYAPFARIDDKLSIAGDRCDDSSPNPRPCSVLMEETGASRSISSDGHHASVECHFVADHKKWRICASNEIDFSARKVQ